MIKEIKFTDNAINQINHLLSSKEKGSFFRIAIKGGGCSGFQYDFSFDKSKNEDDICLSVLGRALEKLRGKSGQYCKIDVDNVKQKIIEMLDKKTIFTFLF